MQFGLFDNSVQFDSFEELIDEMESMDDDPLASAGTNMVIYRGNPDADIMIIGEAPGTEEDRQGKPFVGRSGQLLDQILEAVELDPEEDVFITNAVFRLPPGEGGRPLRKPTPDEIEYYKPYLLELIRLVDPAIIMLSGNAACEALLGETGITKMRGEWRAWHGRWVMPIFHPAYLLRNPSRQEGSPKALTWKDIREVRRKHDEITSRDA
ncbi:MAG: uracil-DNA glycosylase [Candidatus Promineifilaceae bacterium]|nr:uracil-DNA glycosylase [Candidatus Promineifilaceae bacterium]